MSTNFTGMKSQNISRIQSVSPTLNLRGRAEESERVQSPQYEVRLAVPQELDEVFALRYDVFLAAHRHDIDTMRDEDQHDSVADHLIVKHDGRIVGTYRVLPTDRILAAGLEPYAAHEFDVNGLFEQLDPRKTVELGRSCVHPAYRQGSIPKLLWSALAKYMMAHNRSEAVGCVSVFNCSNEEAASLVNYFKSQRAWTDQLECPAVRSVEQCCESYDDAHLKSLVPPLLRSYLMLGAKILGGPAHDPIFQCNDFLMHFSTSTMSERCRKTLFS